MRGNKYGFDSVKIDPQRESVKPLYEGIRPGTIRSDLHIPAEDYCKVFGHHPRKYGDGTFCRDCDKPL